MDRYPASGAPPRAVRPARPDALNSLKADWVVVPTGSMNPTVIEGDRVPFKSIHLTEGADPQRGDIVVFDSPKDGTSLVKRLIAVPGDSVAMRGEELIVNGLPRRP